MKPRVILGAIAALAAMGLATWLLLPSPDPQSGTPDLPESTAEIRSHISAKIVRLTDAKRSAAQIQTELVQRQSLQLFRTLPARFAYNDTRHVSVRSASEGVLEAVLVKTGDAVEAGQPLATLRSPTLGDARSRILNCQTRLQLAEKAFQWESDLYGGIERLTQLIRQGEPPASIREKLQDQVLGDAGGQLLMQYGRSELAARIADSVGSIADSGAISGRIIRERSTAQQQAKAELDASMEQTLFQSKLARDSADAAVEAAKRDLQIANQSLSTLLGAAANESDTRDISPNDPDLSRLTIRSPLTGTVESKVYSATERVTAQSELFVIADTSTLWVEADIRSRDWDAAEVSPGDTVMVSTPSVNGPPSVATVYYLGREVDPASGALPLVAEISNAAGRYRPGLFARVAVPTSTLDNVIAVPGAAVVDLDGEPAVFVQRDDGFLAQTVELGQANDEFVEIRSGLDVGESIVVTGAFLLKSELLLGGEE